MLKLIIPAQTDVWDPVNECFKTLPEVMLRLEHSLVSIYKWEAKWHKPYLSKKTDDKTVEEIYDYFRCMNLDDDRENPELYHRLTKKQVDEINAYIDDPMTATKFFDDNLDGSKKTHKKDSTITAEIIYYWMISLHIPIEWENRPLQQLLTLVEVCNRKNQESDPNRPKMGKQSLLARNAKLNAQRRAKLHTKG